MKKLWRYKLFIFLFSLAIIGVNLVPRCVEVYRYKLNAEVSFVNDDLRGALLSYKKAYAQIPLTSLKREIEIIERVMISKSQFTQGQEAEKNQDFEMAYYYYSKVDKIDSARYACAQHKLLDLSNKGTSNFRENS